jgi:hypothetical protein
VAESPASQLFAEFVEGGLDRITKAMRSSEFEDRFLDYKESKDKAGRPSIQVNRTVFAKCASAFANGDGGVIVWGVKDKGGVREASPIPNVIAFAQELSDQANNTLDPPLMGITSHPILLEDGTGYVVTLIPNSVHKPHSVVGGCCYMRVEGNSVPMPMQIVRALVFAQAIPELALVINDFEFTPSVTKSTLGGRPGHTIRYICVLNAELHNLGSVAVKEAAVAMPWDQDSISRWTFTGKAGIVEETTRRRESVEPGWAQPVRMFRFEGILYPRMSKPLLQISLALQNERDLEEIAGALTYSVHTAHMSEDLKVEWPRDLVKKFLECIAQHDIDLRTKGLESEAASKD